MSDWAIIEKLAVKLGVKARNREKWRTRGIPRKWRFDLAKQARQDGIDLEPEALERTYPARQQRAA